MSLIKLGELNEIRLENPDSCIPEISAEVLDNFKKMAGELKKIAPKADDFLYFSSVIIHSAEASAINDDGTSKLNLQGEPVQVGWDKSGGTWKWASNDPNIRPYKNSNGDIFPEEEIIKAYKKWKFKPLCVDHKSSSVDHVRGFIVDTYYDRALKRVIALCALDKAGFPQLARQVSTGVSNCVSMGTAVGKAICYDCGRGARTEAEFCNHMRNKTCYGEINTELNPIELSIVMTGADAKATIKNVLAAANTMNTYLENKQQELHKIAVDFTATLAFNDGNDKNATVSVSSPDLESFHQDVDKAIQDFQKLQSSLTNEEKIVGSGHDQAFNQSSGSQAMDEGSPTDSGLALQTPQTARFASLSQEKEHIAELHQVSASIARKLDQMRESLDSLATSTTKQHEGNMSGSDKINKQGYFQGAGGVNEPTPGQTKYPKDPLNEQLREHEDKQMVGQSPFPEVGPVDGMHPSPGSADPSNEFDRKKMLARAEAEERALKRNAVVELAKQALKNKQAYWQGGGGVNEPTPGKPTYPKDKLNEELREYEDKQMVGQPPFPGVGPVDGLHPSPSSADVKDEYKRKELLSRASLRARFVKASNTDGSANKNKSAWEVFQGDRLILTASVEDLAGGLVAYEDIATKEFGASLIEKVKTKGAETVFKMIKKAQVPPPVEAPPADGVGVDAGPPAEDAGKAGDPKASALELVDKTQDVVSDLKESIMALTGEQAEMGGTDAPAGDLGGPAMADDGTSKSASFGITALNTIRKDLNTSLTQAMKEAVAELTNHEQELSMIAGMYDNGAVNDSNKDFVGAVVEESISEAKSAIAEGVKLMTAFVKYARGTTAIVKRAQMEAELQALATEGEPMSDKEDTNHSADGGDLMGLINDTNADIDAVHDMMNHEGELGDLDLDGLLGDEKDLDLDGLVADDNDSIQVQTPEQAAEVAAKAPDATVMVAKTASYGTREGRTALRAKLAADALGKQEDGEIQDVSKMKFSDMLDQADKLSDGQTKLDIKPSDHLGLVETLPEVNKAMLEVAKAPPKVRKEAEVIQRMVSQGKLDPKDVDDLVAQGLDKDAVSYWKKYFGEVDGGSEFASELVKEHVKASLETELTTFKVKVARAYEMAHEMASKGLCRTDRDTISAQAEEIMKWNDEGFESMKRVVAKTQPLRKEASIPQVGFRDDITSQTAGLVEQDDYAQLSSALGTKKGMF